MNSDFVKELETATKAVRAGGKIIRDNYLKSFRVVRKDIHELVADVDMFSQQKILDILVKDFPDYGIISEELNFSNTNKKMSWIVDPLDGTHNYIAGLPFSSVSVGLGDENGFYLGVIYFPLEDKLYHAVRSKGAFCNGKPIHVSKNDRLDKSVVNYDNQFHLNKQSFVNFERIAKAAFTIRIFGTATVDLCFISNGTIDARIWNATKIFDIAAGSVILTEAGGKITTFQENEITFNSSRVVASNSYVHEQVLNILDGN